MKNRYLLIIAGGIMFFAAACKKSSLAPIVHPTPANTDTFASVYIAGYINAKTTTTNYNPEAAYWKNGAITILGDSLSSTYATGIAVQGSDVYVVGYTYPSLSAPQEAVLWKNGVETMLTSGSVPSMATSVAVNGNDVYITGYTYTVVQNTNGSPLIPNAVYWKNDVEATLPGAAAINSVFVNNGNVFIGGAAWVTGKYSGTASEGTIAAYWENGGQSVSLGYPANYENIYSSSVNAIAVSNQMVYATGITSEYSPELWKNTAASQLRGSSTLTQAYGIAANSTDVYVVGSNYYGNQGNIATYWKDNVPAELPSGTSDAGASSVAKGVSLFNQDIYIVGQVWDNATSYYGSVYWKNGAPVVLATGGGTGVFANSIVVAAQ